MGNRQDNLFLLLRAGAAAVLACIGVLASGCGVGEPFEQPPDARSPETAPAATDPEASNTASDDANYNPFARAVAWPATPDRTAMISGTIADPSQADFYNIGPVYAGDRIVVELQTDGGLDPAVALLDADQTVLIANDARSFYTGLTNPDAGAIVGHDSPACYVAVASGSAAATTGTYTLKLTLAEDALPAAPPPQRVYLNFDGAADVVIGNRPRVDVPPFDAAAFDPDASPVSRQIIEDLVSLVAEDFSGLNVEIYSSEDGPPPAEPYSVVYFGTYDPALLGVADNVDEYNQVPEQDAIVFTDTFTAFAVLHPTVEEWAQALANVTSHEIGHLLGLYHTADPRGIMDVTGTLRQLLTNQAFTRSPLHPEVFPAGDQDDLQTLVENVGGDLAVAEEAAAMQKSLLGASAIPDDAPPARDDLSFGTCSSCLRARAKRAALLHANGGHSSGS